MSTRVQKGGTVFKPVAKPRPRMGSEARQTPHAPERRTPAPPNTTHSSNSDPAVSMPPPSTVPQKPPSSGQTSTSRQASTPAPPSTSSASNATIITPSRDGTRPAAPQTRPVQPSVLPVQGSSSGSAPVAIGVPSRTSSRPPQVMQAEPVPYATHEPNPDIFAQSAILSLPDHDIQGDTSAISDAQIDPALLEAVVTALRHVDESNAAHLNGIPGAPPQPALNTEPTQVSQQQKRQTRSRAGAEASAGGEGSAGPSKPRVRRRKASAAGDEDASSADTRRRRSTRQSSEAGDEESSDESRPRRKRTRRARAPSVPPFDPDADPGEEIDPTAVTMADLCDDLGRGKVSSKAAQIVTNHAAWRAANKEKRARLKAIAEAKKYGRNLEEEEEAANAAGAAGKAAEDGDTAAAAQPSAEASSSQVDGEEDGDQRGDDYDYTQNMATSRFNVQVRIGPNGETIIDEGSLFVDRQEEDDTAEYTHIEESDTTKFVNSMTYSKKLRGSRWSAEETELFYDALQQFGENYELISYILPGRDRKACKNKFKAEDKRNPNRINYCLKNRRPYDMQTLTRMTGKDFSGPTPVIKAPTPPQLPNEQQANAEDAHEDITVVRKQSRTPAGDDGEEIIGVVDE